MRFRTTSKVLKNRSISDDTALEVINNNGEIVLQIEFDNNAVQISGIFYEEDGIEKLAEN